MAQPMTHRCLALFLALHAGLAKAGLAQGPALSATSPARQCSGARHTAESLVVYATRCAEEFVRRNGYTPAPPAPDTLLLAEEAIEYGRSWPERLRLRRATLDEQAVSAACSATGCGVTFRYLATASQCRFRLVTMTAEGAALRIAHQDVAPEPDSGGARRCPPA